MTADLDSAIHELADWLRIPSVSTAGGNPAALREAAEWAGRRILEAGGTCELVESLFDLDHPPLVVGELRAARDDAPTVLIYGHYDVQDPGGEERWTTPPFEPDIRDGRIYARGASDDKGNFLPLLLVACELADAGELGVHVRVLIYLERWGLASRENLDVAGRYFDGTGRELVVDGALGPGTNLAGDLDAELASQRLSGLVGGL